MLKPHPHLYFSAVLAGKKLKRRPAQKMRLTCELELIYSLAVGASGRSSRSRAAITLGKKPGPAGSSSGGNGGRREEMYLIVSTTKNVTGSKYKAGDTRSLRPYSNDTQSA